MKSAETGRLGERAALNWLRREGYEVCETNWRYGRYEIDIVARRWDELHLVEVKTRRAGSLAPPEAAITPQKRRAMLQAARLYADWKQWPGEIRIDLAAVDVLPDGSMEVRFIPDAVQTHW